MCIRDSICPFELLKNLHPSPAVCGYPKNAALDWINTLESFPRENYASPMGWVDASGNASFLLAIRGARYTEENIEFTAGSGIVSGSVLEKEIDEIKLKFELVEIVPARASKVKLGLVKENNFSGDAPNKISLLFLFQTLSLIHISEPTRP